MAADRKIDVGLVMGSRSDWSTMVHCAKLLKELGISYESLVVSAHRTPDWLFEYAENAEKKGLKLIIAAAGGAAHLPGMLASKTMLPVVGVPIKSSALNGLDSLLSIVQMPGGIPVATMAIGEAGAKNAALFAAATLSRDNNSIAASLKKFREKQTGDVLDDKELSIEE